MKKTIYFLAATAFLNSVKCFPQEGGNAMYADNSVYNKYNYNYNNNYSRPGLSGFEQVLNQNDSAIIVSANILLNTSADTYRVTFGLNQEAKTLKECNDAINKRIESFKAEIKKIGIADADVYVDFICQTKIYDYQVNGNKAEQYLKGFEIKKNIIIKVAAHAAIEQLQVSASAFEIYDVVKVDFIVSDVQKIYTQLMNAASDIIKQKKDLYAKISSFELWPGSKIFSENFYTLYPNSQYKNYQAFETSEVYSDNYKSSLVKKDQRKNNTFYYDGMNTSGFDNVINPASPEVGIQFVMELKIKFMVKKGK